MFLLFLNTGLKATYVTLPMVSCSFSTTEVGGFLLKKSALLPMNQASRSAAIVTQDHSSPPP